MTKDNINLIRDAVIAIVLTVALLVCAGYIPFASLVCFVCSGVPLAFIAAKYELKVTIPVFLIAALVFLLISGDWMDTVTVMTAIVLPGIIVGHMLRKKSNFYSVLIAGSTVVCLGWILAFAVIERIYGIKIDHLILTSLADTGRAMKETFRQAIESGADFGNIDVVAMVDALIEQIGIQIMVYLPGIIVLMSSVMGYILLRISGFVIKKTKAAEVNIVPFSMMKVPRSMCWIAILAYMVYIFATPLGSMWTVFANVALVLQAIMVVGGLSCVDYWLGRKIRFVVLRVLIYVAAVFVLSMIIDLIMDVLVIIAVLDSGRDFRKIEAQQQ